MRQRLAMLLILVGIGLGIGQYFLQRKPAVVTKEAATVPCDALIAGCGYCPGDPRPHCGLERDVVTAQATYGLPFAVERAGSRQIFLVNFLVFFAPAALVGWLLWAKGRSSGQPPRLNQG